MKIEKINENQIRCTLTKEDLAERELKLSELAYGSEKAKSLFRDMMQQASYEFGFEAEEIPLMIEAIPLSAECIVLIITKVEDPDELDTRFSKFSSNQEETPVETANVEGADGILDLYKKIHEEKMRLEKQQNSNFVPLGKTVKKEEKTPKVQPAKKTAPTPESTSLNLTKLYALKNLDTASSLAYILTGYYNGTNSLYKNPASSDYVLVVNKSEHSPEDFNKVCNIISEYGQQQRYSPAAEAFLEEHYEPIILKNALQILATI